MNLRLKIHVGLLVFALGCILFGVATMRAGALLGFGGLLIAIGATLYVLRAHSQAIFARYSFMITFPKKETRICKSPRGASYPKEVIG